MRALDRVDPRLGELTDPALERVEARDDVQRALRALSDEEREVVALRYGAEMSAKDMAKLLGERETTVEGRLYRALSKLREQF